MMWYKLSHIKGNVHTLKKYMNSETHFIAVKRIPVRFVRTDKGLRTSRSTKIIVSICKKRPFYQTQQNLLRLKKNIL